MLYIIKSNDGYYLKHHLSLKFPYHGENYATKLIEEAKMYFTREKADFALEFTTGRFAAGNAKVIGVEMTEYDL